MKLAVFAVTLAGCGLTVGAPRDWIDVSTIEGALAPDIGPIPDPSLARSRSSLRVVTYNVHLGGDPEGLAEQILAHAELASGDVFLFQEEESYPGEGRTRASRVAALLHTGWVYIPGRMTASGGGTHGLAILSRLPIEDPAVMTLPATDDWEPRIAIRADILVGETRLPIVDVHLETRINITDRIVELRPAVIDLPRMALVAGDVNTNPFLWEEGEIPVVPIAQIADTNQAPILDDYMATIGFVNAAANVGPTHRVLGIESRLDAIFTRGLHATDARVERSLTASDHWPVWSDITLPTP